MKCHDAQKWMILRDSGDFSKHRTRELATHLDSCEACRDFEQILTESRSALIATDEPSAKAVQNVLREARLNAPTRKPLPIFGWKPALAMAASVMIGLGLFFGSIGPDKVGMELVVTETQLLDTRDQMVSIMYDGLSEDDLAFNFLMTYEGNG